MSIRIVLDDAPEFYTNLDVITGRILLNLNRPELIGAIIAKLEGESHTLMGVPEPVNYGNQLGSRGPGRRPQALPQGSQVLHENHKILYKVNQVFPDMTVPASAAPVTLAPGHHEFPFKFKVPFNNQCSDPTAMSKIGGLAGAGGYGNASIFGLGGIRVMDGTKQLLYAHVTTTLPPSFTGFPRQAEIRYYLKVTIQRPGLLKENWRYQTGFRFLPIEPPRPKITNKEAYARRPFTFRPRTPAPLSGKRSSFFGNFKTATNTSGPGASSSSSSSAAAAPAMGPGLSQPSTTKTDLPPNIEMSARLPHPSILTCNRPIPLRILAKQLSPSREQVHLTSFEIDLVGTTHIRCQQFVQPEITKWVVLTKQGLSIPVCDLTPSSGVGVETMIPDTLWRDTPLPNTVMPSFKTCNLGRTYSLDIKIGLSWGLPPADAANSSSSSFFKGAGKGKAPMPATQTIYLPLHFSNVQIYSGLTPPESLVTAAATSRPQQPPLQSQVPPQQFHPHHLHNSGMSGGGGGGGSSSSAAGRGQGHPPPLPSRPSNPVPAATHDTLYPPQLAPGEENTPEYTDAPPSYDEAIADTAAPIMSGNARPAWSGVTDPNAPSSMPEKN